MSYSLIKKEEYNGDASSMITGTDDYYNAPVCHAYQRLDSEIAGLQQANELQVSPLAGRRRRNHPQWPPATTTIRKEMESRAQATKVGS